MIENTDIDKIKSMKPFGDAWEVDSFLGKGAYGSVYKIIRNEYNEQDISALKWIPLPPDESYNEQLRADDYGKQEMESYYENLMKGLRQEIRILKKFAGSSHVVSYEDHQIIKRENGEIGYDIFIRMEYLETLNSYLQSNKDKMIFQDVIRLGIDLSDALILCQKNDIIHRDIKPENIFYKQNIGFKLGDFGIARQLEITSAGYTQRRGTPSYMAPEVHNGGEYGSDVDMYSLGLVMYRLLNDGRKPFDPPRPEPRTPTTDEAAFNKRMGGEPLPRPRKGGDRLWEIIRRACAFSPSDRYSSVTQMREDLAAILRDKEMEDLINPNGETIDIGSLSSSPPGEPKESEPSHGTDDILGGNKRPALVKPFEPAIQPPASVSVYVASSAVTLLWAPSVSAQEYRVYRSDEANESGALLTAVGKTEYTDTSAVAGRTYFYSVTSVQNTFESKPTALVKAVIPMPPPPPPRKPWTWIGAGVLVFALLVVYIITSMRPPAMGAVSVVEESVHIVKIRWEDKGAGPWTVTALPVGQTKNAVVAGSKERDCVIAGLIPGVVYDIRVKNDTTRAAVSTQAQTKDAPMASSEQVSNLIYYLKSYKHSDLPVSISNEDFESIMEIVPAVPISGDVLTMTDKPIASQMDGYLFSLYFKRSNPASGGTFVMQLVLRFKDSGAYSLKTDFPEQKDVDFTFFMDTAFNLIWEEKGSWPADPFSLELYADGKLVMDDKLMKIQVNQE